MKRAKSTRKSRIKTTDANEFAKTTNQLLKNFCVKELITIT